MHDTALLLLYSFPLPECSNKTKGSAGLIFVSRASAYVSLCKEKKEKENPTMLIARRPN